MDDLPDITQPGGAEPALFQVCGPKAPVLSGLWGVGKGGTGQEFGPQVRHVPGAWTDSWPNTAVSRWEEVGGGSQVWLEAWVGVRMGVGGRRELLCQ